MKSNYEVAQEVLQGLWGNGAERKQRLWDAGYQYDAVQSIVNALVNDPTYKPDPDERIKEIEINLNEYDGINLILRKD